MVYQFAFVKHEKPIKYCLRYVSFTKTKHVLKLLLQRVKQNCFWNVFFSYNTRKD